MTSLSSVLKNKPLKTELESAIRRHVTGTHITMTYPGNGIGRRLEAHWHSDAKQFVDPGNNIWLRYNEGDRADLTKRWEISMREYSGLGRSHAARELINMANLHARHGRLNQMWHIYWMLILMDHTQYHSQTYGVQFDLHFEPFDEQRWLQCEEKYTTA